MNFRRDEKTNEKTDKNTGKVGPSNAWNVGVKGADISSGSVMLRVYTLQPDGKCPALDPHATCFPPFPRDRPGLSLI